jgi:hypothetical protein
LNVRGDVRPAGRYFARHRRFETGTETIELSAAVVSDVNSSSPAAGGRFFDGDDRWTPGRGGSSSTMPTTPIRTCLRSGAFRRDLRPRGFLPVRPPWSSAWDRWTVVGELRLSIPLPARRSPALPIAADVPAAARAAAERLVSFRRKPRWTRAGDRGHPKLHGPADGVRRLGAPPPLDGRVSGSILASDGVTKVGSATAHLPVNLQSDHILRRVWPVNASSGLFRASPRTCWGRPDPRTIPEWVSRSRPSSLFGQRARCMWTRFHRSTLFPTRRR